MPIACRPCARPSPDCRTSAQSWLRAASIVPKLRRPSFAWRVCWRPLPAWPCRKIAPEDIAVMLYSSGTTGRAKGVLASHGNLLAAVAAVSDAAEPHCGNGPQITVSAMPIAHIFGVAIMNDLLMTPTTWPTNPLGATTLVRARALHGFGPTAPVAPRRPPCPRSWPCSCTTRGHKIRSLVAQGNHLRRCAAARSSWRRPSCAAIRRASAKSTV